MWNPFKVFKGGRVPFKRNPEMDALIRQYREICAVGTTIALDGEGLSEECRQREYYQPLEEFLKRHGERLLRYLEPYRGVKEEELVSGKDNFDLYTASKFLFKDMKNRSRNQ